MPILETPNPNAPLTQGDVLNEVVLHSTSSNWDENGGRAESRKIQLSLVISRPCVAAHKSQVVVAAIGCRTERPPADVDSFEQIRSFLTGIRDGNSSPDRFYLGQIPGQPNGRYYAELDSLHTIGVPKGDDRTAIIHKHRVATLTVEFQRDLHSRLFRAFAPMGFDDDAWFADQDLEWLVTAGKSELSRIDTEIATQIAGDAASGMLQPGGAGNSPKLSRQRDDLMHELDRYVAEQERRASHRQLATSASDGIVIKQA